MRTYCICGCKRRVFGKDRKYFDPKKCRHRYLVDAVRYGTMPLGELIIGKCSFCKQEMLYYRTYPTKTCTQYSGGNCNRKLHSKRMNNITICKYNAPRPKHISTYCHQGWLECKEYSKCGGKRYQKGVNCFIRERYTSGVQGISSRCTINI